MCNGHNWSDIYQEYWSYNITIIHKIALKQKLDLRQDLRWETFPLSRQSPEEIEEYKQVCAAAYQRALGFRPMIRPRIFIIQSQKIRLRWRIWLNSPHFLSRLIHQRLSMLR